MTVLLDSGASEDSEDGTGAEELAREDDAVIGEFSVVLSVGTPTLELLGASVGTYIVVESTTVLLNSGASDDLEDGIGADELATDEDAVIGEFSVVLSVTVPMLELGAYVGT